MTPTAVRRNLIRNSGEIECRVVEWLLKGINPQEISERLARFYNFKVCDDTVRTYKETFFDDAENEAIQVLRKKVAKSVELDLGVKNRHAQDFSGYIESLYEENIGYAAKVTDLNNRLKKIKSILAERAALEPTAEDQDKTAETISSLEISPAEDRINAAVIRYQSLIRDNRQKIAEKVDGESGSVVVFTKFKAKVIEIYFNTTVPHIIAEERKKAMDDFRLKLNRL
jgi:hypothetical protein